jgi:RNA polymerase sigma-70 factor, ECF subfamily
VLNSEPSDEFLDQFTRHQVRLYRYIVMLVANPIEAEDILQNTNLVLLRKCDRFQPGSQFFAWAAGIAHFEVLKHRASRKRQPNGLSDTTLSILAAEAIGSQPELDRRNAALPGCMEKLPAPDRTLVTDHYFRGLSWEAIARTVGRSSSSIRHSICRIRRELKRCIDVSLGIEAEGDV